jgi:N6-L-threonylcarbamoyladenine synthase
VLDVKLRAAAGIAKSKFLVASGGVAGNGKIRAALAKIASDFGMNLCVAPPEYCSDNGVMIAYAGERNFAARGPSGFDVAARPRWPLEELCDE